ncbi:hypothetical protein ABXJ76_05230 [Methylobacter sp. G7]|uniref:hypothetical protein n=1 Tax=Methylobacter sp. G7 TaxID=3230117 RepID=UPI003D800CAB
MHKFNLLSFAILSALISLSFNASADISTDRAVISNNGSEQVTARVRFQTPVNGDLYIAVQVNGELLFLADEGANFTTAITPFRSNSHFSGSIDALNISGLGIAPGRYLLYQVVTEPGSDPLNFMNWMGGLGGLSTINFSIGLPANSTGDFDNNGFPDDDNNHDGYHDDDSNHNGFHDDDQNHDGFHDDDVNRDGLHDDQENERVNDHGKHVNDSND